MIRLSYIVLLRLTAFKSPDQFKRILAQAKSTRRASVNRPKSLLHSQKLKPFPGVGAPRVPAHHCRALCPVLNSREVGKGTFESQKLVKCGTFPFEERFSAPAGETSFPP